MSPNLGVRQRSYCCHSIPLINLDSDLTSVIRPMLSWAPLRNYASVKPLQSRFSNLCNCLYSSSCSIWRFSAPTLCFSSYFHVSVLEKEPKLQQLPKHGLPLPLYSDSQEKSMTQTVLLLSTEIFWISFSFSPWSSQSCTVFFISLK